MQQTPLSIDSQMESHLKTYIFTKGKISWDEITFPPINLRNAPVLQLRDTRMNLKKIDEVMNLVIKWSTASRALHNFKDTQTLNDASKKFLKVDAELRDKLKQYIPSDNLTPVHQIWQFEEGWQDCTKEECDEIVASYPEDYNIVQNIEGLPLVRVLYKMSSR